MELRDRYLKDVALWLPIAQAADIVAEVSDDIQTEVDEQERALGRALTAAEEEAIITRWGHPMLVASRYQPQEPFIGPVLLPTYYFVLKMLALVYCLPWFLAWVGFAIFDPAWRTSHPDLVISLRPLLFNALFLFALATTIFVVIERRHRRNRTLETWTARELVSPGKKRDWREIPRIGSAVDAVIGLVVLSWWVGLAGSPASFVLGDAIRLTLAPLQSEFYWAVLTLMIAGIVMATAALVRPRWTTRRLGIQIAVDMASVLVVGLLLPTALVQVTPGSGVEASQAAMLERWVNLSWTISLVIAGAILVGRVVIHVRRLGRVNSSLPTAAVMIGALVAAAFAR